MDKHTEKKGILPRNRSISQDLTFSFSEHKFNEETLENLQTIIQKEGLAGILGEKHEQLVDSIERRLLERFKRIKHDKLNRFSLMTPVSEMTKAMGAIVKDDFSDCFRPNHYKKWTTEPLYVIFYILGACVRYLILLPVRFLFLLLSTILFCFVLILLSFLRKHKKVKELTLWLIIQYCRCWLIAIGAVFWVSGKPPRRRKNQIYVANHTSVLDVAFLIRIMPFSFVGQKSPGLIGFFQKYVLFPLECMWFERFERNDRSLVRLRMYNHIGNTDKPPLFVFPEGVCVNNNYTVMFRKGVFEFSDVEICPIAIKYNKMFGDMFFRNNENFFMHFVRLMKEWCVIGEIKFLEPVMRKKEENPIAFSKRVQGLISKAAGLKPCQWDGYLKFFTPSQRWKATQQKMYAEKILEKLEKYNKKNKKENEGEEGEIIEKEENEKEEGENNGEIKNNKSQEKNE